MTFNWGTGITLAFIVFATFMLTLVYKTTQVQIDLVADDYYAQEIVYQDRMDHIRNARQLQTPISIQLRTAEAAVSFQFPKIALKSGTLYFFRPSDAAQDKHIPLELDPNYQQLVAMDQFQSGHWRVKMAFEDERGRHFYDEQTLYIP
ncbi:MAG: FixH family protein [Bernardetiaceae bacterium]